VTTDKTCKDCAAEWGGFPPPARQRRPAPHPGPRCATHWRDEKKRRKQVAHEKRVQNVYGLGDGDYDVIYKGQGGKCAICQRATGATRKLSVDHDHKTGEVRGLLCRPCNNLLGHARDDTEFFERAKQYLINPPARVILEK
jgi:hypothetical protein